MKIRFSASGVGDFISVLLHPLILPTPVIFLLFRMMAVRSMPTPEYVEYAVYSIVFTGTFLLPLLSILLLSKIGIIQDVEISKREERKLPYLITAISFTIAYYFIQKLYLPKAIYITVLGGCLAVLVTMIINLFWKISAHMISMGGVVGAFIGVSLRYALDGTWVILTAVLLSGLLGFSRLVNNDHTPNQVYTGFLIGLFIQLFLLLFIK